MTSKNNISELADQIGIITLVCGETENNKRFWAYVSVKPSRFEKFLEVQKKGNYDLNEWGEILRSGDGISPPDDVKAEMEEDYGINHDWEKIVKDLSDKIPE